MVPNNNLTPLFVDLDGTLIKTDLLHEAIMRLIKSSFWTLFVLPWWLLKGKAHFKSKVANIIQPDFTVLPYNAPFIEFLRKEKEKGRKIYLATASNIIYANSVAKYLDIFDDVIASDDENNLKGKNKLQACQKIAPKFSYAGDTSADFDIFEQAVESHLVNPTRKALAMVNKHPVTKVWPREKASFKTWLKAIRLHQWLKNLLLFVPLFVSGQYIEVESIVQVTIGFIAFGLLASATYIVNDLLDLDADRQHPRKQFRPFASGTLSIIAGFCAIVLLLFLAFLLAGFTPVGFQLSLVAYLIFTLTYSFFLKYYVIADVISLAGLFTLRIIAGALILEVSLSFWLLAFSMFIFFSLALVKRCAEIKMLEQSGQYKSSGRDYNVADYGLMQNLGVTSSFMAILLMAFYVHDAYAGDIYSQPVMLWLTLPAFVYWLCRMWLKTSRSEMHDDPIIFSLKDKGSVVTIAFICLVTLVAKL